MKKLMISAFLLIFALFFKSNLKAQGCDFYFPVDKGTKIEMTDYDKKGKVTGVGTSTITDFIKTGNAQEVKVSVEYKASDNETPFKSDYSVKCENGEFYVNMNNFLDKNALAGYQNMDIKVDAEQMTIPSNLQVGQALGNGRVTAKISNSGINLMTMNTLITNRKVAAFESITTPAGTFDCVKITYDIESKVMFKVNMSCAQWYSKDVGVVKTETYDKKGKLETSQLLTKISK
ncbi:MAG: hypothetical protein U0W24_19430 [Bacteroidales bacterium]